MSAITATDLVRTHGDAYRALLTAAGDPPPSTRFDNRPTWDNIGGDFDNRPTWDNWNKK